MSGPSHHPGEAVLIDYAGGALCEGAALVVATHLAFCPCCRDAVADLDAIGGALLEDLEPEPLAPGCLDALLARIDRDAARGDAAPHADTRQTDTTETNTTDPRLPAPLRGYLRGPLERQRWRFLQPGMRGVDLRTGGTASVRLLRLAGGVRVPRHTHDGLELTVVLEGGFSDAFGAFGPGDMAVGDATIDHSPRSDPEGCLCLAATIGALRLTGPLGRWVNRVLAF